MQPSLTEQDTEGRYTQITGVILAGGRSIRMGSDKAFLTLSGRTFIEILSEMLRKLFLNVVISTNHFDKYSFLGLPVIPDIYKDCGPLGGIHAVLRHLEVTHGFFISCDLPLLSQSTIQKILRQAQPGEITICKENTQLHPLCGVFPLSFQCALEKYITGGGRSVLGVLSTMPVHTVDVTGMSQEFQNINTPLDYYRIIPQ